MKEANGCIENKKRPNDRPLDVFAERQLKNDGDLEQDRNRGEEFSQHEPQRMKGDIGRRIRADLAENALRLGAAKSFERLFHRSSDEWARGDSSGKVERPSKVCDAGAV